MTPALGTAEPSARLHDSNQLMRRIIVNAGCSVPAAALTDAALAQWVRSHGVTVTAHDDDELDIIRFNEIRPVQVVFRCGPVAAVTRRAVALGVTRFIVSTSQQMARLADGGGGTNYIYLDDQSPLVLGDRHLRVIGLHSDVDDSGGALAWASAAERLLCRSAVMKTCGTTIKRIALSGGSTDIWLDPSADQLSAIVVAVDDALREGCDRWQVARPAVTLSALTVRCGMPPAPKASKSSGCASRTRMGDGRR